MQLNSSFWFFHSTTHWMIIIKNHGIVQLYQSPAHWDAAWGKINLLRIVSCLYFVWWTSMSGFHHAWQKTVGFFCTWVLRLGFPALTAWPERTVYWTTLDASFEIVQPFLPRPAKYRWRNWFVRPHARPPPAFGVPRPSEKTADQKFPFRAKVRRRNSRWMNTWKLCDAYIAFRRAELEPLQRSCPLCWF